MGYDERVLNKAEALKVIAETHCRSVDWLRGESSLMAVTKKHELNRCTRGASRGLQEKELTKWSIPMVRAAASTAAMRIRLSPEATVQNQQTASCVNRPGRHFLLHSAWFFRSASSTASRAAKTETEPV